MSAIADPKPAQNLPVLVASTILAALVVLAGNIAGQKQALAVLIGGHDKEKLGI